MDVRWVNSHYQAGKNLFNHWKVLVHFFAELIVTPRLEAQKKEKVREILNILLNRNAISLLAFQIDLQSVFKAVSLEVQEKHSSFLGQSAKKGQIIDGLNRIGHDRGYYMYKVLREFECVGIGNQNFQPCGSIANLESAAIVRWEGFELIVVNEANFEKISTIKDFYLETLVNNVEFYLPTDAMMRVFRWSTFVLVCFCWLWNLMSYVKTMLLCCRCPYFVLQFS